MRVLYNLTDKKTSFAIIIGLLLLFGGQYQIYPHKLQSETKYTDWSLPYKMCREIISDNENIIQLASDNNNLFTSTSKGFLQSINPQTNEVNWAIDLGSEIISNIQTESENIYVASKSLGTNKIITLRSISKLTGITFWQTNLKTEKDIQEKNIHLVKKKNLIIFSNSYIISFRAEDGYKNWEINRDSKLNINLLNLKNNTLLDLNKESLKSAILRDIEIFGLNQVSGDIITESIETPDSILIGNKLGRLDLYNKLNGKKNWSRKIGGKITGMLFSEPESKKVLVSSFDNFLYLFSTNNGKLIWKRRFSNRIRIESLIKGKAALVSSIGGSDVFLVEIEKGKVINQISLPLPNFLSFTGKPLFVGNMLLLPTNRGVFKYSQNLC